MFGRDKKFESPFEFKRVKSKSSCKVDDITSFVFGGFSSRFWLLRKHVNSMSLKELHNLPFFCWECVTLNTQTGSVNIVIKNQKQMTQLLEFLVVKLETIDGNRGTANKYVDHQFKQLKQKDRTSCMRAQMLEKAYISVFHRFNLLRIRMKISYMALMRQMTVKELFLSTILNTFIQLSTSQVKPPMRQFKCIENSHFEKLLNGRLNLRQLIWSIENKITMAQYKRYQQTLKDTQKKIKQEGNKAQKSLMRS